MEFGGIVFCKERIHDIGNSGRPATIARKKTVPHFKEENPASAFLVFPSEFLISKTTSEMQAALC